jgi:membrane protein DedA with SNARE-associated domain
MNWIRKQNDSPDLSAGLWICLLLIIGLVAVALYFRGFDFWTVILIAVALVCPAIIVWAVSIARRDERSKRKQLER